MKKIPALIFVIYSLLFYSCTKDRVSNPDSLNFPQTVIYSENFDDSTLVTPDLPAGWKASPDSGWQTDSTNFSANYDGASGLRNIVVSNDSLHSGTNKLYSATIATTHYKNITVIYGVRNSKHFPDNGSMISSFAYSIDDGNTWTPLIYTNATNDSNWYLINNSVRILLPENASDQAGIKFRWIADLQPTPSGTYRIDDFQVLGTLF